MKSAALILALSIGACSSPVITPPPAPKTPAQTVFEVKAAEGVALAIFVKYKGLPSCALPAHPVLCSDPAIVTKVQGIDAIAARSIDTAETAVRTPGFGTDTLQSLVAGAQAAVSLLTSATSSLKVS